MRGTFITTAFLAAGLACGSAQEWKADQAHSRIALTVTHMQVSEVSGRFTRFDYGVQWDRTLDTGGLVVSKEVALAISPERVKQK